jgi:hypothetical protein
MQCFTPLHRLMCSVLPMQVDTKHAATPTAGIGHKFGVCVTLTP